MVLSNTWATATASSVERYQRNAWQYWSLCLWSPSRWIVTLSGGLASRETKWLRSQLSEIKKGTKFTHTLLSPRGHGNHVDSWGTYDPNLSTKFFWFGPWFWNFPQMIGVQSICWKQHTWAKEVEDSLQPCLSYNAPHTSKHHQCIEKPTKQQILIGPTWSPIQQVNPKKQNNLAPKSNQCSNTTSRSQISFE